MREHALKACSASQGQDNLADLMAEKISRKEVTWLCLQETEHKPGIITLMALSDMSIVCFEGRLSASPESGTHIPDMTR